MSDTSISVAVAGQPNCGKSTMFNAITGSTARVGNYPGISVERTEGVAVRSDGTKMKLVDLPGTYSLTAYSQDEIVARNVIIKENPDVVINLLDATSLERSLYLTLQTMELDRRVVIGLNMMDEVKKRHIHIDSKKLSELMGVPVVECCARRGIGVDELLDATETLARTDLDTLKYPEISYGPDIDPMLKELTELIQEDSFMSDRYPARWLAIKYLEGDELIIQEGQRNGSISTQLEERVHVFAEHMKITRNTYPEAMIADYRYGYINGLMRQGIITRENDMRFNYSDKIDKVVTHKLLGPVIMCVLLYAMFYITFTLGAYPQGWVESIFWSSSLRHGIHSTGRTLASDGCSWSHRWGRCGDEFHPIDSDYVSNACFPGGSGLYGPSRLYAGPRHAHVWSSWSLSHAVYHIRRTSWRLCSTRRNGRPNPPQ